MDAELFKRKRRIEELETALAAAQAENERLGERYEVAADTRNHFQNLYDEYFTHASAAEAALEEARGRIAELESEKEKWFGLTPEECDKCNDKLNGKINHWRSIAERVREYTEELESHFNNYPSVVLAPAYEAISRHLRALLDGSGEV